MWLIFALLSALFAALTAVLAKIGIDGVNGTLATAIRTAVVLVMAWGMVFLTHAGQGISAISQKSWLFLILSGLATGASWLCYYHALQLGRVRLTSSRLYSRFSLRFFFCGKNSRRKARSAVC